MNILLKIIIIIAILIIGILLAVFVKKITENDVNYAGPMLDKILTGIKNENYYELLSDASSNMKNDFTEKKFNLMITLLNTKIGDYKTKIFNNATITHKNNNTFIVVTYNAKYSKNINDIKITMSISDDNIKKRVEALTFNSSNLGRISF